MREERKQTVEQQVTMANLEATEARLQFESFDVGDAYALGCALYDDGAKEQEPYAVRVMLDGIIAFQAFMPGTGAANEDWLNRKCATVCKTGHCSLWSYLDVQENGAHAPWQEDTAAYALYGGGFPLVVSGELRGVVAISGMPHFEDHRRLVATMEEYLNRLQSPAA